MHLPGGELELYLKASQDLVILKGCSPALLSLMPVVSILPCSILCTFNRVELRWALGEAPTAGAIITECIIYSKINMIVSWTFIFNEPVCPSHPVLPSLPGLMLQREMLEEQLASLPPQFLFLPCVILGSFSFAACLSFRLYPIRIEKLIQDLSPFRLKDFSI